MIKFRTICLCCILLPLSGCEQQSSPSGSGSADETGISQTNWMVQLTNSHSLIIQGPWNKAEVAWDELRKGVDTDEEIERWIAFQVEILEQTKNDSLKEELRETAIQEMYWYPEASKVYRDWLERSLKSGLLDEKIVRRKAEEVISLIDNQKNRF